LRYIYCVHPDTPAAMAAMTAKRWLGRVHHDLVKRLLWPARDRREAGGPVHPGELSVILIDDEGRPVDGVTLWSTLCEEAPATFAQSDLDAFGNAIGRAVAAGARDQLAGVLALEAAFAVLSAVGAGVGADREGPA
jgi:hypothetical protein